MDISLMKLAIDGRIKVDEMTLETLMLGHLDNLHTDEALNNRRVMKGIFS